MFRARPTSALFLFAALGFCLLAMPALPALGQSGQTVKIYSGSSNEVCGNGLITDSGNCDTLGTSDFNWVYIYGGTIVNSIYGGKASGATPVTDNKVIIQGGDLLGTLDGAQGSTPPITAPRERKNIYGGWSESGSVENNMVSIETVTRVDGLIIGGWVNLASASGGVSNNQVVIDANAVVAGNIYGGFNQGHGTVVGNSVIINNGTINSEIIAGGYRSVSGI
ncbi:MAG: hypothetical protein FWG97_05040, partial [Deltaproteobacteria bacterium]|nr:hypothetical protein [Deltaproteobacteria bacterium]